MVLSCWSINSGGIFTKFTLLEITYNFILIPNQSFKSNEVTIFTGKKVMVFQHEYQTKVKSRQRLIYITGKAISAVPKLPTNGNSSDQEEEMCSIEVAN